MSDRSLGHAWWLPFLPIDPNSACPTGRPTASQHPSRAKHRSPLPELLPPSPLCCWTPFSPRECCQITPPSWLKPHSCRVQRSLRPSLPVSPAVSPCPHSVVSSRCLGLPRGSSLLFLVTLSLALLMVSLLLCLRSPIQRQCSRLCTSTQYCLPQGLLFPPGAHGCPQHCHLQVY